MIYSACEFENYSISARDGVLGSVKDLLFDEESWLIRYFVVETGSWLNGRRVLLSAPRLAASATGPRSLSIDATQAQVRNSPPVEHDQPLSRDQEQAIHDYYGWPYYWGMMPLAGGGIMPMSTTVGLPFAPPPPTPSGPSDAERSRAQSETKRVTEAATRLQSAHHVRGYEIAARDGAVGKVDDLLLDDSHWKVRHIVVDTHKWIPGRKVLVPVPLISAFRPESSEIVIDVTREELKRGPEYDPADPAAAAQTDQQFEHYSRTRPRSADSP